MSIIVHFDAKYLTFDSKSYDTPGLSYNILETLSPFWCLLKHYEGT